MVSFSLILTYSTLNSIGMFGLAYLGTPVASLYIIVVLPDSERPRRKTLIGLRSDGNIKCFIVAKELPM
jgi:hypothetical protein